MSVSKIFEHAFDSMCGSLSHDCECGAVHFDGYNDYDWEEGELESLRERAKTDKKYIEHDHSIGWMEIGGCDFVYDCPCSKADQYEKFISSHGSQIATYLNALAKEKKEEADNMTITESLTP